MEKGKSVMKKKYVKPTMDCEEFAANEYIAACYYFHCEKCNGDIPYEVKNVEFANVGTQEGTSPFVGYVDQCTPKGAYLNEVCKEADGEINEHQIDDISSYWISEIKSNLTLYAEHFKDVYGIIPQQIHFNSQGVDAATFANTEKPNATS